MRNAHLDFLERSRNFCWTRHVKWGKLSLSKSQSCALNKSQLCDKPGLCAQLSRPFAVEPPTANVLLGPFARAHRQLAKQNHQMRPTLIMQPQEWKKGYFRASWTGQPSIRRCKLNVQHFHQNHHPKPFVSEGSANAHRVGKNSLLNFVSAKFETNCTTFTPARCTAKINHRWWCALVIKRNCDKWSDYKTDS